MSIIILFGEKPIQKRFKAKPCHVSWSFLLLTNIFAFAGAPLNIFKKDTFLSGIFMLIWRSSIDLRLAKSMMVISTTFFQSLLTWWSLRIYTSVKVEALSTLNHFYRRLIYLKGFLKQQRSKCPRFLWQFFTSVRFRSLWSAIVLWNNNKYCQFCAGNLLKSLKLLYKTLFSTY